ncbi:MAG: hypothetical protein HYZ34_02370 [Ignavibacteriae bacterium]|nr:hypothetical protein [Ignavibacteriota bacterium]
MRELSRNVRSKTVTHREYPTTYRMFSPARRLCPATCRKFPATYAPRLYFWGNVLHCTGYSLQGAGVVLRYPGFTPQSAGKVPRRAGQRMCLNCFVFDG